jgi:DNA-binding response OmpR family regulator
MPEQVHILLIEDDIDDIDFFRNALLENQVDFSLETLTKGDHITVYLKSGKELPDIIIMDLNLPKLHGREVLRRIRHEKKYRKVPLIVLTTSTLEEDRNFCLENGADKFVSKPTSPEGFNELIRIVLETARNRK